MYIHLEAKAVCVQFISLNLWPRPLASPRCFSCLTEIIGINQDQFAKIGLVSGGFEIMGPLMLSAFRTINLNITNYNLTYARNIIRYSY